MPILYVQTTREHTTNSRGPTPIPELSLELPEGAGEQAIIILNTQAMASGSTLLEGYFKVSVDGVMLPQLAEFSSNFSAANNRFTIPCTLVAAVPLKLQPQKVQALWFLEQASAQLTIRISSLTAIMA